MQRHLRKLRKKLIKSREEYEQQLTELMQQDYDLSRQGKSRATLNSRHKILTAAIDLLNQGLSESIYKQEQHHSLSAMLNRNLAAVNQLLIPMRLSELVQQDYDLSLQGNSHATLESRREILTTANDLLNQGLKEGIYKQEQHNSLSAMVNRNLAAVAENFKAQTASAAPQPAAPASAAPQPATPTTRHAQQSRFLKLASLMNQFCGQPTPNSDPLSPDKKFSAGIQKIHEKFNKICKKVMDSKWGTEKKMERLDKLQKATVNAIDELTNPRLIYLLLPKLKKISRRQSILKKTH